MAYEHGDEAELRSILADWEAIPDTVEGEGVGAELIRVIRKIAPIHKRLSEIESEIQQLNTSDLCQLTAKADEAETQGRDFLKEMASQLETQISTARNRLTTVTETMADT